MDVSALNPFGWSSEPFIVLIILALLLRFKLSRPTSRRQRIASETLAIGPAVLLYFLVRGFVNARFDDATANAQRIIELEKTLGIYHEAALQEMIVGSDRFVDIINWIYIWGHWPVVAAVIVWLVVCRPTEYPRYRNALILSGAIGMVIFATFPVTPPRLMEGMAYVDTVTERSRSYRILQPPGLTNPYAAVPSLHFGWNLLMGIAIIEQSRRAWVKGIGLLMPAAMYLSIVLTANHYFLDGVVGGLLVLVSLAFVTGATGMRHAWWDKPPDDTASPRAQSESWAMKRRPRPLIIAHRHGNCLELLKAAESANADIIEVDVWLYRGRLEVRHTKTLGPLPLLWDRWYLQRADTPRLLLEDLLRSTGPETVLMLDIKGRNPEIAHRVITELERHHAGRRVMVCSQNWQLLEAFRSYPDAILVHSIGNQFQLRRAWALLSTDGHDAISIQFRLLDDAVVRKLKERVSLVFSWPISSTERYQDAVKWGLDGVITEDLSIGITVPQSEQHKPTPQLR
jgi:glycerophosphoryl diester phosphodiesterase